MARKASCIIDAGDRKSQVAALRRELKLASAAVRDHDRETKRVERETTKVLKNVARKRAQAAKVVSTLERRLETYGSAT